MAQKIDLSVLRGRDPNTYLAKSVAGAVDVTLTASEMKAGTLEFTGIITADISVIFPLNDRNVGQMWRIKNLTTGPFTVRVKVTSQTGVVAEKGALIGVVMNGTDLVGTEPNTVPRRFELKWAAGSRGKPGLNADINSATEATREIADPDFELLGTNAVSSCSAYNAEGGIKLTTTTGSGDQVILVPHLDTSQSAWGTVTWGTDQETVWEGQLRTGAAITAEIIWAGLKLTNTSVLTTDAKQAFFRYEAGVNSGKWAAVYSINNVDVEEVTALTVAVSTTYHLKITIDSSRIARFYINGLLVKTSTALDDTSDLIPYIGIQTATTAAKDITVHGQSISRKFA